MPGKWRRHLMHLRASTMLPLSQFQCLLIVILADKKALLLKTDDAMMDR